MILRTSKPPMNKKYTMNTTDKMKFQNFEHDRYFKKVGKLYHMINQFFHCFFCCSQTCWGCHSAVFVIQGYAELEAHFWWPRYLKILKKDLQHRILIAKEWNCWILQFNYMHSYANLKVISIRKLYKNINWQKFYSKSKDDSVFKLQTVLFLNILHIDIGETYF